MKRTGCTATDTASMTLPQAVSSAQTPSACEVVSICGSAHGTTGIVHVSNDIAAGIRSGQSPLPMFRYDIDWLDEARVSISFFVSRDYADQVGLPEPAGASFGTEVEEQYAAVCDALAAVCDKCFNEYLHRTA